MSAVTEVLIVGAGPTGLVTAIQMARYGIPVRIIDKARRRSDKSRALAVHARSLELLSRLGVADDLIRRGIRAQSGNIHVNGRLVTTMRLDNIGVDETPYPFILLVSQAETEEVLETHLRRFGVTVERPKELTGFTQENENVSVFLREGHRAETLHARYVVGADGAHSAVRHGCNMTFEGERYANDFILADVDVRWDRDYADFQLFLGRKGVFVCFALPGKSTYRLISTRQRVESQGGEPTLAEFEQRLRDHCQVEASLSSPRWLATFRLHHRGVDRYRDRRIFVAGDAAHIHSPAGGQGMNTGIQDAWNLSWKLALVLSGRAQPALLDSYHQERHPVGQRLLNFTDRLFSVVISRNGLVSLLRTALVPLIAPFAMRSRTRRARAFRFVSQIGIRYKDSLLNEDKGGFDKGPRPGERLPDMPLIGPAGVVTGIHAQLDGKRYQLFVFLGVEREAPDDFKSSLQGYEDLVKVTFISAAGYPAGANGLFDREGAVHRRFGIRGSGTYLVRPDDHVAFRCEGLHFTALRDYLVRFLLARNESGKNSAEQYSQRRLSSMS